MNITTLTRDVILDALSSDVVDITFTKKDGTERVMRCTRDLNRAPHAPIPKNPDHVDNDEIIRAYDLEAEGWRSFIVSNVKSAIVL